jgi:hypothetical protein
MKKTTEPKLITYSKRRERPTLEQAQKIVGGYVEMVTPINKTPIQILCNEDGWLLQLPLNMKASALCGRMIVGDAIVLSEQARWID